MPRLRDIRKEKLAFNLASGMTPEKAYSAAGYPPDRRNAVRAANGERVRARVDEIMAEQQALETLSTKRAIERMAMSKEIVGQEFARIGFANIMDFTKPDDEGGRVPDLSNVTRDQMAAVQELTVDYYVEGRGENAMRCKKVRLKLYPKTPALIGLSRLFGWIVDGAGNREPPLVERLKTMTDEQIDQHAREVREKIDRALALSGPETIEGERRKTAAGS
jgi:phage terminase small subunit